MKISIISQFVFPIGYSGTNRVLSLSRGLKAVGDDVKVYIYRPYFYKEEEVNKNPRGEYMGVEYEYPIGRTYRLKHKITKLWDINWGVVTTLYRLYQDNKNKRIDSVIITNDWAKNLFAFSVFAYIIGIKNRVFIVDEYPNKLRKGFKKETFLNELLFKLSFRFINKSIFMTDNLEIYYRAFFPKHCLIETLKVPITVEADRFMNLKVNKQSNNITYIGNFEIKKDGLDILVKSFAELVLEFPEMRLQLAGNAIKNDLEIIKNLVRDLKIENSVDFLGQLHRDEVPEYLFNSKILVMSRPSSLRAEGGFPSKLGEYMLTGIPVLVTRVGEIPVLLKNNENIYLSEPGNVLDFYEKMKYILRNYQKSVEVGKRGKEFALKEFNNIYQAKRINGFLN